VAGRCRAVSALMKAEVARRRKAMKGNDIKAE
jgi:hypothetical protein